MSMIELNVNQRAVRVSAEPRTNLADFVRDKLDLTGTHLGCEHGVCGACTVLLDGVPARSCITYAVACEGAEVTTIEGLGGDDPVQRAFEEAHAFQCGWCTPGLVLAAKALLAEVEAPGEREIREALAGNLCRCGSYAKIVDAVRRVHRD